MMMCLKISNITKPAMAHSFKKIDDELASQFSSIVYLALGRVRLNGKWLRNKSRPSNCRWLFVVVKQFFFSY